MKKNLYSVFALLSMVAAQAQIFNAGFENNNGTPLSEFKKVNQDGNTVPFYAEIQDFNTEAWNQFYDGYDDKIALSTSFYDPSAAADDWLITPQIFVPSDGTPTLYWKGKSYDFEYTDSYAIKVSETDDNPDSFTAELLQVNSEQPFEFASHSLDLSAYKGKTIYLAFVNNTFDGTYLALNDLYISNAENCILPETAGITVANLKPNSFTANWTSTEGISQYDTALTTFDVSVVSDGITSSTTKDFASLQSGKRYQFFLKNADCGSGWAGPVSVWTPSELPYSYDFEKTSENYGEYDSDGWTSSSWLNGESETAAQSGTGYVYNNTSASSTKNDWIFSYPVYLQAGETLNASYYTAISNASANAAQLKIAMATSPAKEAIVSELTTENVSQSEYAQKTASFTATADGVYYLGFGNITSPVTTTASLRLDNVSLTKTNMNTSHVRKAKIKVFPNPVKDILHVVAEDKIEKIEVFSADGKLIKTTTSNEITFENISKGLYIIKIYTAKGVQTEKIIK